MNLWKKSEIYIYPFHEWLDMIPSKIFFIKIAYSTATNIYEYNSQIPSRSPFLTSVSASFSPTRLLQGVICRVIVTRRAERTLKINSVLKWDLPKRHKFSRLLLEPSYDGKVIFLLNTNIPVMHVVLSIKYEDGEQFSSHCVMRSTIMNNLICITHAIWRTYYSVYYQDYTVKYCLFKLMGLLPLYNSDFLYFVSQISYLYNLNPNTRWCHKRTSLYSCRET